MAKKPYKHTDLSGKICSVKGCDKHLKKNVVSRKPTAKLCYKHWKEADIARRNRR